MFINFYNLISETTTSGLEERAVYDGTYVTNDGLNTQQTSTNSTTFIQNQQTQMNQFVHKCCFCAEVFINHDLLMMHKRRHVNPKTYKCEVCEKTFFQISFYRMHKETAHRVNKQYECDLCKSTFSQISHFAAHKRTHNGTKSLKCNQCDKSFWQPETLLLHQKMHTGEKSFKCEICWKEFSEHSNAVQHKLTHKNTFTCIFRRIPDRTLACDFKLAAYEYKRNKTLYKCETCKIRFSRSRALMEHKRLKHTGENNCSIYESFL